MSKRPDALGFFWEDHAYVKPSKAEKPKPVPPEPVWLRPDYLPGLDIALLFPVAKFTDAELVAACVAREPLVYDIECYENYFLIAFRSIVSGKVIYFELTPTHPLHIAKLKWIVDNFLLIDFNGNSYDVPILSMALAGKTNMQMKGATYDIIVNGSRPSDVLRSFKVKGLKINHIDLIEVAPLRASLKIYGGRLHAPKMQDLPFHPDTLLNSNQMAIVRWYCVNDLVNTQCLHHALREQIDLRISMSKEYGIDLRSKSDAQIAEAVISEEVETLNGTRAQRPQIAPGTAYHYHVPTFIRYETPLMNWALDLVRRTPFIVSDEGNIGMPDALKSMKIEIAGNVYRMGIGGLHSSEEKRATVVDADTVLVDRDVTSYYPMIILNQGLYPQHLGRNFLKVYRSLVNRRLEAKRSGNKVVADSLKITINGSFGKLGSQYSVLYAPDLLIQVTVTGQLSLLMLIETLELRGIRVVSANTDGIAILCPKARREELNWYIAHWEKQTQFETEETEYRALYSRDVNNYVAVYKEPVKNKDGSFTYTKTKGAYAKSGLQKNPTSTICVDAAIDLLVHGTPLATTVKQCTDIRKFVTVRTVKGGAVKDGVFLGKSIRWYYATGVDGEIVIATSGYRVPRSDGAKPLMELPDSFPQDVNFDWYITEAERILQDIAYA